MKLSSLSEALRAGVALPRSKDRNYFECEPVVVEFDFKTISDISLVSGSIKYDSIWQLHEKQQFLYLGNLINDVVGK
jgi:hypothetical protein